MQNLQTYQIEDSTYELDTYYNIGKRSRFKIVGIIDVNSTIFFIGEREDGEILIRTTVDTAFQTKNFIFYALQFHYLAKNTTETQP
jgi:hypothetical protein